MGAQPFDDVRDAPRAETAADADSAAGRRALLEVLDRDGHVRQVVAVERWPLRIGRALDNDVVLSDPHVAAHHCDIDSSGATSAARLVVNAGETRNGVVARHATPSAARRPRARCRQRRARRLQLGRTRLRLRLPGHALGCRRGARRAVAVDAAAAAADAGARARCCSPASVRQPTARHRPRRPRRAASATRCSTTLAGGAIWCGAWALLSKTFTRQSHFGWHLRVFVVASLALLALDVRAGAARVRVLVAVGHRLRVRRRLRDRRRARSTSTCSRSSRRGERLMRVVARPARSSASRSRSGSTCSAPGARATSST